MTSLTKFTSSSISTEFMKHLKNDQVDRLDEHKNSQKQCDETGHLIVNIMESQWKLRRQQD